MKVVFYNQEVGYIQHAVNILTLSCHRGLCSTNTGHDEFCIAHTVGSKVKKQFDGIVIVLHHVFLAGRNVNLMRAQVLAPLQAVIKGAACRWASGLGAHREGSEPAGGSIERDRGFNIHLYKFHSNKSICLRAYASRVPPGIWEGLLFNQGMPRRKFH